MELDKNKTKYFVIAIILLIILGVILIVHFNNKKMVSADKGITTKKTTEKIEDVKTTTKKDTTTKISEVDENKDIYKSVVDSDTKLLYNYKLTDEISNTDIIISKPIVISEELKVKNVIGLFDISLYDTDLVKKDVKNSLITISVPITGELVGFDNYKVIYIDTNNNITDEEFNTKVEDGYITFDTTHLSIYGIIGTKSEKIAVEENKEVDIESEDINVTVAVNDEQVDKDGTIYAVNTDEITLNVSGVDNYKLYYGLKEDEFTYNEYVTSISLAEESAYKDYKLMAKVVVGEKEFIYELNTIKIYDIVLVNNISKEDYDGEPIGIVEDIYYSYDDEEVNKDIVVIDDDTIDIEDKATVNVMGNIYLVDKTDITNLEMTGYLYIDTDEEITFNKNDKEQIDVSKLYGITIMSKTFNLNGSVYTYEKKDGKIIITKVEENPENNVITEIDPENEENIDEDLGSPFTKEISSIIIDDNDSLVIELKEELK